MVRDIVIFGPTHNLRELGLLFWDAGLLSGAVFVPSEADVGSAKKQREHPPVQTGLKIALHGHAGIHSCYLTAEKIFIVRGVLCFSQYPSFFYLILSKYAGLFSFFYHLIFDFGI